MIIGVPKETTDKELRVGMTPEGIATLVERGHRVLVGCHAGIGSGIPDDSYAQRGGEMVKDPAVLYSSSDMIVKVKEFQAFEWSLLYPGLTTFSFLSLGANRKLAEALINSRVTAIAYETMELGDGSLPILKTMSALTGRLAVDVGSHYLKSSHGGSGKLLSGISGVTTVRIVILGAGVAGFNAAELALNMGAHVTVLSRGKHRLMELKNRLRSHRRLEIGVSSDAAIAGAVEAADVVIGAVRNTSGTVPTLVTKTMIRSMQKGSVVIDACIDQGGCIETSRETTLSDPIYIEEGIIHYCVRNMPGSVPRTATESLCGATMPYIQLIAEKGVAAAIEGNSALSLGVNTEDGQVVNREVGKALGY